MQATGKQVIGIVLAVSLSAQSAQGALLLPEGQVLVNRGNGFVAIAEPAYVQVGDQVLVNQGKALLQCDAADHRENRHSDTKSSNADYGRRVLHEGHVYTIDDALCGSLASNPPVDPSAASQAAGSAGIATSPLLIGGAVVGIGAGVAILSSSGKRTNGASP